MNSLFTGLLALLTNMFFKAEVVVVQGLTTIGLQLPLEEAAIVQDAIQAMRNDLTAGKSVGEALADAYTVFYNEEKTEFSKVGQATLALFAAALQAAQGVNQ